MLTSLAWMMSRFATPSTATGKTGPSWRYSNTGGDSAALRYRLARKQGLQGLRFALGGAGQRAECRVNADVCGIVGKEESANLGAHRVCTPVRAKTARDENSMLVRVCSRFAGWVAEIGPRAFAHRLTQQTHFYVTLHTRARARAQRQVTTTCVRCVRHAGVSAAP